jgi:hypothetical protein
MFLDAYNLLSDAQAVTADAYSTNTIDLGASSPARQIGDGEPMAVVFTVDVALAGTTPTIVFNVVDSANANLSSHTVLVASKSYSALAAGAQVVLPIPPGLPTARYLGAYYDVGGTTPTITLTAALMPLSMIDKRKDYADGITIS